MVSTAEAVRERFEAAAMSGLQKSAVALTFVLSALDGYDLLSIAFTAPAITVEWGVGKAALGIVLSSGLVGMALGSFLLAPLADVIGRRRVILLCLPIMGLGMMLSGLAHSLPQLAGSRVLTGLGIGTCIAAINLVSAEFANARWRPFSVALARFGGLRLWTVTMMIGFGVVTAAFGSTRSSFALLLLVAGLCGFLLFAAGAGYYGLLASSFSDGARASGVGFVIGAGRISSAIAPSLAGGLFASGWGRAEVSATFGAAAVAAGMILIFHDAKRM
jgi:hypothetical protein